MVLTFLLHRSACRCYSIKVYWLSAWTVTRSVPLLMFRLKQWKFDLHAFGLGIYTYKFTRTFSRHERRTAPTFALSSLHSLDGGVRGCVWYFLRPIDGSSVPATSLYLVDCTTPLNDRCAREACSFDGKLVDDKLFPIRQTTPTVRTHS